MQKFKYQPSHLQVKQKSRYVYTSGLLCQISAVVFWIYMKVSCC